MSANYKNYPVLSVLVQAGGWMEVSRILASVQHAVENAYIYSAAIAGKRVMDIDSNLTKIIRPRKISTMNLFGFVDETRRIDKILADLVTNTNGTNTYKNFDTACPGTIDEITLPYYLKDILDYLFSTDTAIDKGYYVFEAENFPFYKLKFKDKDTLVDFVNHCRLEGVVYKHIESVEYDKCQGYVDDDDFTNITTEKRIHFLADALRLLPFAITHDTKNKYLFHTPDDGNYLVLTEEEETAYATDAFREDMLNGRITETPGWEEYLTDEGRSIAKPAKAIYKDYFTNKAYFDLDAFLTDHFEDTCELICKKEGIIILIEDPVVMAIPQKAKEKPVAQKEQ